jgi:hypothetical protein
MVSQNLFGVHKGMNIDIALSRFARLRAMDPIFTVHTLRTVTSNVVEPCFTCRPPLFCPPPEPIADLLQQRFGA